MTSKDFDKLSPEEKVRRYFLARLLWWKHDLEELDADAVSQLIQVLEETRRDIRKRLLTEAGELAQVSEWTRERLEAVDQWAGEVLAGASATITETITVASATAGTASLATYNAMLSFEGKAAAIQTVGMTPEQLRSWFQDTPLEGNVALRGWVDKAFSSGIKKELLASLQRSGVEGKGTTEAVRRLMDKAVAVGATITQREAVTLARTYVQAANVGAMNAVYQANKRIITQVEWCAVLDNRVCPRCAGLDGRRWGIDEPHAPIPLHPRCRCLLLPRARSWRDFGVNIPDLDAVARPWVIREPGPIGAGGRKILYAGTTKENFGGWWATLPKDQQDAVLGPVRAGLVREGKIRWDDNVDPKTGRLRTLAEVGYSESGTEKVKAIAREVMPNVDKAVIPPGKIAEYSLNPDHPRGGDKARVLMAALNLTRNDTEYFSRQILQGLPEGSVIKTENSQHGDLWKVLINVKGKNNHAENVTTGWIYKTDTDYPSLTTAYLKGKKVKS